VTSVDYIFYNYDIESFYWLGKIFIDLNLFTGNSR